MPSEPAPVSIFGGRLRARPLLHTTSLGAATAAPAAPAPPGAGLLDAPPPGAPRAPAARGTTPPAAGAAIEARLIEILEAPLAEGETAAVGFRRKEEAIGAVFAGLTALQARALRTRFEIARAGDRLVERFGRLTAERRHRLLTFLADARRREALRLAQVTRRS